VRGGILKHRYHEIEQWLRERLAELSPGDRIPSEAELADRFGVSRMTARQAVQNLSAEGLVRRRPGSGTFATAPPLHRQAGPLLNFSADMRRRGKNPSSHLLEAGLREATADEADGLGLRDGERLVAISRVRLADNTPIAIEHATLPVECAGVLAGDLEHGSLHEALTALGRRPRTAQSAISARTPTGEEAKLLDIDVRSPLLVERRRIQDDEGEPLEYTETIYAAERYVIDASFAWAPNNG